MPANLNDLLDWFDQAEVTVNNPGILKAASVQFKSGNVTLQLEFKQDSVPWPAGLKDCNLVWTRENGM